EWMNALLKINPILIIVATLVQCITFVLLAFQLQSFLSLLNKKLSIRKMLHIIFISAFVEGVTPSSKLGGEVGKALYFKR
ncbi:lysylphosphatidylglycerol synthase domain-containing protein, partial [Pseudomonas sp. 2995-3]|uniref:lysylphosphatidylglycerol synthase domain-containing protein n=1 Tax=Pseudomonas sp. 2995-3 TaxID=1712680 RepID=UPI000C3C4478